MWKQKQLFMVSLLWRDSQFFGILSFISPRKIIAVINIRGTRRPGTYAGYSVPKHLHEAVIDLPAVKFVGLSYYKYPLKKLHGLSPRANYTD
jgi:hypothetical protein